MPVVYAKLVPAGQGVVSTDVQHLYVCVVVPQPEAEFISPQYPPGPPSAVKHEYDDPVYFAAPLQLEKHPFAPSDFIPHVVEPQAVF